MKYYKISTTIVTIILIIQGHADHPASPEKLKANWIKLSDKAHIELVLDNHFGKQNPFSPDIINLKNSFNTDDIKNIMNKVTVIFSNNKKIHLEKINRQWYVTNSFLDENNFSNPFTPTKNIYSSEVTSAGQTFIDLPFSEEHNVSKLSRKITNEKLDRNLFASLDRSASYYHATYSNSVPFVTSTYIHFVTDPLWARVVYGNFNNWIRSYDAVVNPTDIAVDASGRVFIVDAGTQKIIVLKITGESNQVQLMQLFTIENITNPSAIALNDAGTPLNSSDDYLYVADASDNMIFKYKLESHAAQRIKTFKNFQTPIALTAGKWNGVNNNFLYVIDNLGKMVHMFEDTGTELIPLSKLKGDYNQYFTTIKTDHFGNLYIVDQINSQLFKYTSDLQPLDQIGSDEIFNSLHEIEIPFGRIDIEGEGSYWAGFNQLFLSEKWSDNSGVQRKALSVAIKDLQYKTDENFSFVDAEYILTDFADISFRIFNTNEEAVKTINSNWMVSGQKNLIWNRRDENNRQVSPGNYRSEIEAISAYDQTIIETAAEFYLPLYYWQNSGGEKNDDEFLIQGNPQSFGTSPTEKLNRHKQSVIYKFENLKAESEYGIAFEFYSPAGEKRIQNVTAAALEIISNIQFSKEPVRTGFVKLPPESYSSGDITISINSRDDNDAVVSQVWIKETGVQFSVNHLDENLPKTYNLEQNYPNPFNPSTTISFFLPHSQKVELSVYDILGRRVAKLVNEWKNAGSYNINFDASHLASGVYIYRLKAGKFSQSRKMLLVR